MAPRNPHQVEPEVMHMLLKLDAERLLCAYEIIELEVPESKKSNQHLLFKNLVKHLNPEEVEAREDGGLQFFQRLCGFFSKHFKTPDKTKGEPLVNKQSFPAETETLQRRRKNVLILASKTS